EGARALVHEMCRKIRHRGPDDEGVLVEPGVALGMRRLSIIDVSTGRQPIDNEDGSVSIVFNGEIYNFPELRRTLEDAGHRFYTHTNSGATARSRSCAACSAWRSGTGGRGSS